MQVDIKLKKNFERQIDRLLTEYGQDFAHLNGIDEDQVSLTDFLDNFVQNKTVADASVDGNANVSHKDVVTLMSEMSKPHKKLIALHKIYLEINQKYGYKSANDWLEAEWTKALYMHDFVSASLLPYCYFGSNIITVKYNDTIYKVSFEQLHDMLEEDINPEWNEDLNIFCFYPDNLFVLDIVDDKEVWSKVSRVLKHDNEKPMQFIKLSNGNHIIVTNDHPMITEAGEKSASEINTEDRIYTVKSNNFDNSIFVDKFTYTQMGSHIKNNVHANIELTKDFGWLVGFILAEGSIDKYGFNFKQNYSPYLTKAINILEDLYIDYSIRENEVGAQVFIKTNKYAKWIADKFGGQHSEEKKLPPEYIHYNYDFLDGIVSGFADGDGAGGVKDFCYRITSPTLLNQFGEYLSFRGLYPRFCCPIQPSGKPSALGIISKKTCYKMSVLLRDSAARGIFSDSIKLQERYIPRRREGNFENKCYTREYGFSTVVENRVLNDFCTEVYDITTETGHFICNGMLSHNCYAYDLKRLAEEGLFFVDGLNNAPPRHLETFIDFVKEFISYTSNRTSGACGLPNIIPYMYYFWKKDVESGDYPRNKTPEEFAKQHIQRFIYGVNQPYTRDGIQSAFTNTSVYDMNYLEALFGGSTFPDGSFMIDELDEIMQFQKWYMEEMSRIRHDNMFTFPVSTINLLVNEDKTEFMDEDFAEWAIRHNMTWSDSNIFADSSVTSLSNCCRLKSNIKDLGYFKDADDLSDLVYKKMYEDYCNEQKEEAKKC